MLLNIPQSPGQPLHKEELSSPRCSQVLSSCHIQTPASLSDSHPAICKGGNDMSSTVLAVVHCGESLLHDTNFLMSYWDESLEHNCPSCLFMRRKPNLILLKTSQGHFECEDFLDTPPPFPPPHCRENQLPFPLHPNRNLYTMLA